MLQALLADRFKLRVHTEMRPFSVYSLTIAKDGIRMRFAEVLSRQTDHPVVDPTGLAGFYDVVLVWRPEVKSAEEREASDSPSLFTAIQEQLGLKLQSGRADLKVIVVDSAERVPSAN